MLFITVTGNKLNGIEDYSTSYTGKQSLILPQVLNAIDAVKSESLVPGFSIARGDSAQVVGDLGRLLSDRIAEALPEETPEPATPAEEEDEEEDES